MNKKVKQTGKEVGNIIDIETIGERSFDIEDIHNYILSSGALRMSWAYQKPCVVKKDMVFRFTVSGHHHKGHVYIVLGFMDTFNIYYTSNRGIIKKVRNDIYIDGLINILDVDIEKIDDYQF